MLLGVYVAERKKVAFPLGVAVVFCAMMETDPQPISFETIFYVLVCVALAIILIAGVASSQLVPAESSAATPEMTLEVQLLP